VNDKLIPSELKDLYEDDTKLLSEIFPVAQAHGRSWDQMQRERLAWRNKRGLKPVYGRRPKQDAGQASPTVAATVLEFRLAEDQFAELVSAIRSINHQ